MPTKIEWTDESWNPVTGCTKVSPGCKNCYAERMAKRLRGRFGYPADDPFRVTLHPERLGEPLLWRKPRRVFVNSMGDLFHEDVPDGFVMRCLDVMARTTFHRYQILTKRPHRMRDFFLRWADLTGEDFEPKLARGPEATRRAHPSGRGQLFASLLEAMGTKPPGCAYPTFDWVEGMIRWPSVFRNIWLGVSCENQTAADERIPLLLQTPGAVRFVSCEPLIGPLDLIAFLDGSMRWSLVTGATRLDWVVCGGESGPGARPVNPEWVRSIRDQCVSAGVPFFFKQWGGPNKKKAGRELDGRTWDEMPARPGASVGGGRRK